MKPYYLDNQEFSIAVMDYVKELNAAKEQNKPIPQVTDYIATCLLSIARGFASKGIFSSYTYKEEMIMDAVENCLRAIKNYKLETPTRTGKPNAFAYFTQITYFAFLRRLAKEKRHQELRYNLIEKASIDCFISDDAETTHISHGIIETLRGKMSSIREHDCYVDAYLKKKEDEKGDK